MTIPPILLSQLADAGEANKPVATPPAPDVNSSLQGGLQDSKYIYRYPLDLGKDGIKNYTVFYINVRNRDLTSYERNVVGVNPSPSERTREARIRPESEKVRNSVSANTTLAAMALGAGAARFVTSGKEGVARVAAPLLGGIAAGAVEATTNVLENLTLANITTQTMQNVQLKHVIALPLMSRPSATYQAGWVDFDMGMAGGLLQGGVSGEFADVVKKMMANINDGNTDAFTSTLTDAWNNPTFRSPVTALLYKKMASADLLGTGTGEALEKATARTPNPFREQLFKTMGFRTFSFGYTFLPKSRKEAYEVRNIINLLKYYMHPGLTDMNFFMTYPAEFNIKYFYDGKENDFLHKISTCALTNLEVDYGSGEDYIAFKPDRNGEQGGVPTEISLKLQFTELELLSKQRIQQGY